jgi:tetratricopeptide (TPR) repeat protein
LVFDGFLDSCQGTSLGSNMDPTYRHPGSGWRSSRACRPKNSGADGLSCVGDYQEALEIFRQLAKPNPAAYQPAVATTLNNLAILYSDTQRLKEAEAAYQEALDISRQLPKTNPAAYQPVATTLNNLAVLHLQAGNLSQATEESQEAVSINRERWKENAVVAGDDLAKSLIIASVVQEELSVKCRLLREAASVAQSSNLRELTSQQMAGCPPP